MATTTVQGPPTEAEIRAALEARFSHPTDGYARDMEFVAYLSDGLAGHLWEVEREEDGEGIDQIVVGSPSLVLDAMIKAASPDIEARIRVLAINELVKVGLRFSAAYPDAPRAREAVPA